MAMQESEPETVRRENTWKANGKSEIPSQAFVKLAVMNGQCGGESDVGFGLGRPKFNFLLVYKERRKLSSTESDHRPLQLNAVHSVWKLSRSNQALVFYITFHLKTKQGMLEIIPGTVCMPSI